MEINIETLIKAGEKATELQLQTINKSTFLDKELPWWACNK